MEGICTYVCKMLHVETRKKRYSIVVYVSAEPVRPGLTCMPPQWERVVALGSASISQFQTSVSVERQVLGGHFQATACSETASPLTVEPDQKYKVRYQVKLCTY